MESEVLNMVDLRQMQESGLPGDMTDNTKACRESAVDILVRRIANMRRRADGLEALLNAVKASPAILQAEEALWNVLTGSREVRY